MVLVIVLINEIQYFSLIQLGAYIERARFIIFDYKN